MTCSYTGPHRAGTLPRLGLCSCYPDIWNHFIFELVTSKWSSACLKHKVYTSVGRPLPFQLYVTSVRYPWTQDSGDTQCVDVLTKLKAKCHIWWIQWEHRQPRGSILHLSQTLLWTRKEDSGLLRNMNGQELCHGQKGQVLSGTDTTSRFLSSQPFFLIHKRKGQGIHRAHRIGELS